MWYNQIVSYILLLIQFLIQNEARRELPDELFNKKCILTKKLAYDIL